MYSVVLMAALTTGTDMPDCGRRGGCCGCYGGWGGCYGGCGGCYGGWGWRWAMAAGEAAAMAEDGVEEVAGFTPLSLPPMQGQRLSPTRFPSRMALRARCTTIPRCPNYNRATIIVHLPDTAKLVVDGKPTASTSGTRRFSRLRWSRAKAITTSLRPRMERDGKVVKADQRGEVGAGDRRDTIALPNLDQTPQDRPSVKDPDNKEGVRDNGFADRR